MGDQWWLAVVYHACAVPLEYGHHGPMLLDPLAVRALTYGLLGADEDIPL